MSREWQRFCSVFSFSHLINVLKSWHKVECTLLWKCNAFQLRNCQIHSFCLHLIPINVKTMENSNHFIGKYMYIDRCLLFVIFQMRCLLRLWTIFPHSKAVRMWRERKKHKNKLFMNKQSPLGPENDSISSIQRALMTDIQRMSAFSSKPSKSINRSPFDSENKELI